MKNKKLIIVLLIIIVSLTMVSCDLFTSTVDALFDGGFKLPPTINSNTIGFEITGVGTGLRDFDNFPSITLFVSPTNLEDDSVIPNLVQADFFDVIDDNGEARPIEITPPRGDATNSDEVDIVFVIDTTGSMSYYLSTMTSKAQSFADTLAASDIDYRIGFVSFGDDIRKGTNERLAPTSDIDVFKTAVGALTHYGGADGPENQIDAIDYARAGITELSSNPAGSFQNDMSFTYREDATKIFILITDIGYHIPGETSSNVLDYYTGGVSNTVSQEIDKLNYNGIFCYVVGPENVGYSNLAEDTNAEKFASGGDFDDILDIIGADITRINDYMITFMTNDFSANKVHNLRIAVHTSLGDAEAEVNYTSPAVVNYSRALEAFEAGL